MATTAAAPPRGGEGLVSLEGEDEDRDATDFAAEALGAVTLKEPARAYPYASSRRAIVPADDEGSKDCRGAEEGGCGKEATGEISREDADDDSREDFDAAEAEEEEEEVVEEEGEDEEEEVEDELGDVRRPSRSRSRSRSDSDSDPGSDRERPPSSSSSSRVSFALALPLPEYAVRHVLASKGAIRRLRVTRGGAGGWAEYERAEDAEDAVATLNQTEILGIEFSLAFFSATRRRGREREREHEREREREREREHASEKRRRAEDDGGPRAARGKDERRAGDVVEDDFAAEEEAAEEARAAEKGKGGREKAQRLREKNAKAPKKRART